MDMVSWFKPTKANLVGTVLLLAANWAGGLISRPIVQLITGGGTADMAGRAAGGFAGRAAGAYAGQGGAFSGTASTQFAAYGLASSAVSFVVLALLFYVVLSVVFGMLPKAPEERRMRRKSVSRISAIP